MAIYPAKAQDFILILRTGNWGQCVPPQKISILHNHLGCVFFLQQPMRIAPFSEE